MTEQTPAVNTKPRNNLFDRPLPAAYRDELQAALAEKPAEVKRQAGSTLLFTIGSVALALPTRFASAVTPSLHIARIPHRSGTVLLGLVAARGDILPCCSLARLLDLPQESGSTTRTLILEESAGRRWAVPIDSVIGVRIIDTEYTHSVTSEPQRLADHWLQSTFHDGGMLVHQLDPEVLFRQITLATA